MVNKIKRSLTYKIPFIILVWNKLGESLDNPTLIPPPSTNIPPSSTTLPQRYYGRSTASLPVTNTIPLTPSTQYFHCFLSSRLRLRTVLYTLAFGSILNGLYSRQMYLFPRELKYTGCSVTSVLYSRNTSILEKGVVIKFSMLVYRTVVYMFNKFQNDVIIYFKMVAMKLHF